MNEANEKCKNLNPDLRCVRLNYIDIGSFLNLKKNRAHLLGVGNKKGVFKIRKQSSKRIKESSGSSL